MNRFILPLALALSVVASGRPRAATLSFVGGDFTTHGDWRTTTTAKLFDADTDNVYGTNGYMLFGSGSSVPTLQPSYATATRVSPSLFGPSGAYLAIDNPAIAPGPGPITNIYTGTAYGGNSETDFAQITMTASGNFRVGVLQDNHDFVAISPLSLRLRQTVGGTANTGLMATNTDRDKDGDWYFFDVTDAVAGDVFRISGLGDSGHGSNGIGGITFDTLFVGRKLIWNGADGNWFDPTWTGGPPSFPNDVDQVIAVIDTPRVVSVNSMASTKDLEVKNGGSVDVTEGMVLSVAAKTTVSSASTLTVRGLATFSSDKGSVSLLRTTGWSTTIDVGTSLDVTNWQDLGTDGTTLVKTGAGTLNLGTISNGNAGTGLTVQAGRLKATGITPLGGAGGPVTVAGGTFAVDNPSEASVSSPVVVAGSGGLEATTSQVFFGDVTIGNGATLTTGGAGRTTATNTMLAGDTATIAPSNVHTMGSFFDGGLAKTVTIAGTGKGRVVLDGASSFISAGATTFRVQSGTLEGIGVNPLGGGAVALAGGTLKVSLGGTTGIALPTGTLAFYDFNQGTAADASGNGNNATLVGNATIASGALQTNLGGVSGGFAQMPNISGSFTDAATMSAWVKLEVPPNQWNNGFFDFDTNGFNGHYTWGNGLIYMPLFRTSGRVDGITPLSGLTMTEWHLLTVVSDPAQGYKVYQNGQQIYSGTQPTFGIGNFQIGYHNGGGNWRGYVDDFMLLNRGLTATEVANYYALGRDGLGEAPAVTGDLNMGSTNLTVQHNSTLDAVVNGSASFGALQIEGGVVTAQGASRGISFTQAGVAAGVVGGVNGRVPVTTGPVTIGDGGTFVANGTVSASGITLTEASGGVSTNGTFDLVSYNDLGATKTLTTGGTGTTVMNNTGGDFLAAGTTLRVAGGTLAATGGSGKDPLGGATNIRLAGGTLSIGTTDTTFANGLKASLYYNSPNGDDWIRFHQSNSALATPAFQTVTTTAAVQYNGDFQNLFPGMTSTENFQAVWTGQFVPAETGNFRFYADWGDDRELFYVDLNRDGLFAVNERVCGNFDGESRDSGNISLTAGQRYDVAWGFIEYGGGENTWLRYVTPSNPSNWQTVTPNAVGQAGQWQHTARNAIALGEKNVMVEADSGLSVASDVAASVGPLVFQNGVLTLAGGVPGFTFNGTTVAAGASRIGLSSAVSVNPGPIAGNGAVGTFVKDGGGDLVLDQANIGLENLAFDVKAGRLLVKSTQALGGSTALGLTGGAAVLSSSGGDQAYGLTVTVGADSVLRAARGGIGASGPVGVTVGASDQLLSIQTGKTLDLEAADSYSLVVGNSIVLASGATLDLNSAGVTVDQTGAATLTAGTGSTINLNQGTFVTDKPLSIANLNVFDGTLNLNGNSLNVTSGGRLYIGAAGTNLEFTGSATLTTASDATVEIAAGTLTTDKALNLGNVKIQSGGTLNRTGATAADRDVSVQTELFVAGNSFDTTGSTLSVGNRIDLRNNASLAYSNPIRTNQLYMENSTITPGAPMTLDGQVEIYSGSTLDMTGYTFTTSQANTNLYINSVGSKLTVGNLLTVNYLQVYDGAELVAPTVRVQDRAALWRGTHAFNVSGSNGVNSYMQILGGGVDDYINNRDVRLTGTNTYQGQTQIHEATVLVAAQGAGLPNASTVRFYHGILGTSGTFNRQIGWEDGGKVYFDSWGGFAAYGGDLTVSLATASGGGNAPLTWNSNENGFNGQHLYLGSTNSTHNVTFTNSVAIDSHGMVINHSLDKLAVMSGQISGPGVFEKYGRGTLVLSNANNSGLTGETRLTRGVLDVGLNAGSLGSGWLRFYADNGDNDNRGAILQARGLLAKTIGWDEAGKIGWDNNGGGFSARGGDLTVTLNGGATLNWNGTNDGFRDTRLMFGSRTADAKTTFTNAIDSNGGNRIVHAFDNPNSTADYAVISGSLLASNFEHFQKFGDGRLDLSHIDGATGDTLRTTYDLNSYEKGRLNVAGNAVIGRRFYIENGSTVDTGGNLTVTRTGGEDWSWLYGGTLRVAGNLTGMHLYYQLPYNDLQPSLVVQGNMQVQYHTQMDGGTVSIGGNFSKGGGDAWYIRNGTQVSIGGNATAAHHIVIENGSWLDLTGTGKTVAAEESIGNGDYGVYVQNGDASHLSTLRSSGSTVVGKSTLRGSHVYFANNAMLSGNWTVNTKNYLEFQSDAHVSPGNSVGAINVAGTGNMYMQSNSSYHWDLGATGADIINVGNDLNLGDNWNLIVGDAGGTSDVSDQWPLFTYGGTLSASLNGSLLTGVNISLADGLAGGWNVSGAQVRVDASGRRVYLTGLEALAVPTTQTWNADGANAGGTGQWAATASTWRSGDRVRPFYSTAMARFPFPDGQVAIEASGVNVQGGMTFESGTAYEITGGPLTFGAPTGVGNAVIVQSGATATISSSVTGSAGFQKSGAGELVVSGAGNLTGIVTIVDGILRVGHATGLGTAGVAVSGGTLAVGINATLGSVVVASGGRLALDAMASRVLDLAGLTVDEVTDGLVDVGVSRIEIAAGVSAATIKAKVLAGRGSSGDWSGTGGIVSSAIAAAEPGTRSIGYVVAADGSAIVGFAAPGDANMDGVVNTLDLVMISSSGKFGSGQSSFWWEGDFNYDGLVNSLDLVAVSAAGVWGMGSYLPTGMASVPEPASLGLAVVGGALAMLVRRRRSHG